MAENASGTCSAIARTDSTIRPQEDEQRSTKLGNVVYRPSVDIWELDDRYEMFVDLPGTTREWIDVSLQDGLLTIEARVPWRYDEGARFHRAEFGIGDFRRQVRLGEDIDAERISAAYEHGVLHLTLPKRRERCARRIEVRGG